MYGLCGILITGILSVGTFLFTLKLIPKFSEMFLKANLYGIDLNKTTALKIPEAQGVIAGCIYLIIMFLSIAIPFSDAFFGHEAFSYKQLVEMLSALLSICCMLLLGFADDVLDLQWRHKLLLPTVASLPLLIVYFVTFNATTVIVPKPLQPFLGISVDLGFLYYIYMGLLAVFCTNAINILAGVNGLEAGQAVILAIGLAIFNIIEAYTATSIQLAQPHLFALHFLFPYISVTAALFKYNWYPARVFVGDTFCYFSGMTFAVVGILGHFSKTMMLFFIPQIFNFLYSVPQLFHIVPCPRHRLPKLNQETGLLDNSYAPLTVKKELTSLNKFVLSALNMLARARLVKLKDNAVSNLTLINLVIIWRGPMHEKTLALHLLAIQVLSCFLAFIIRYPLAHYFYDEPYH